jgi:hypothetical protein
VAVQCPKDVVISVDTVFPHLTAVEAGRIARGHVVAHGDSQKILAGRSVMLGGSLERLMGSDTEQTFRGLDRAAIRALGGFYRVHQVDFAAMGEAVGDLLGEVEAVAAIGSVRATAWFRFDNYRIPRGKRR